MKVIVLCERSQRVTKAFRSLGIEAYSCDILDCYGGHPEWHIVNDAVDEAYTGKYDLIIAHPPCTYLSNAGARWLYSGGVLNLHRYKLGLEGKNFFELLLNAPCKHLCLENPTPSKIYNLPNPTQVIQPFMFGDPYSKRTLLWLKNLPELVSTDFVTEYKPYLPSNTGGAKRGQSFSFSSLTAAERSQTFEGVAKAMAVQWSTLLKVPVR